jgi:hypothetical protein
MSVQELTDARNKIIAELAEVNARLTAAVDAVEKEKEQKIKEAEMLLDKQRSALWLAEKKVNELKKELSVSEAIMAEEKSAFAVAGAKLRELKAQDKPLLPSSPRSVEPTEEIKQMLLPFNYRKVTYLRVGRFEDEDYVWDEGGDLWRRKTDGSRGAYAGILSENGMIDRSQEVLDNEPIID